MTWLNCIVFVCTDILHAWIQWLFIENCSNAQRLGKHLQMQYSEFLYYKVTSQKNKLPWCSVVSCPYPCVHLLERVSHCFLSNFLAWGIMLIAYDVVVMWCMFLDLLGCQKFFLKSHDIWQMSTLVGLHIFYTCLLIIAKGCQEYQTLAQAHTRISHKTSSVVSQLMHAPLVLACKKHRSSEK